MDELRNEHLERRESSPLGRMPTESRGKNYGTRKLFGDPRGERRLGQDSAVM